jgi:hypothetical protein
MNEFIEKYAMAILGFIGIIIWALLILVLKSKGII